MTIITHKQTITFVDHARALQFTARDAQGPQQAPDWVRDTETFTAAVRSGYVAEITPVTPVELFGKDNTAAAADTGLQGQLPMDGSQQPNGKAKK